MRRLVKWVQVAAVGSAFALLCPFSAAAEWFVEGYGGLSAPQSLKDVTMNNFGLRTATARYGFSQNDINQGSTLTQTFKSSDVDLKSSPIFGGKAGYFFREEGLSWLGVELEAFTTKPTIKQQTVNTVQDMTFTLGPGITAIPCTAPSKTCSNQLTERSTLPLTESSMRLVTLAFNVVARYPGKVFQPYVGIGAGAFYFFSSGQVNGKQVVPGVNLSTGLKVLVTDEWGFFVEGKYQRATITNFDPNLGLSGEYSAFNAVAGLAYHF